MRTARSAIAMRLRELGAATSDEAEQVNVLDGGSAIELVNRLAAHVGGSGPLPADLRRELVAALDSGELSRPAVAWRLLTALDVTRGPDVATPLRQVEAWSRLLMLCGLRPHEGRILDVIALYHQLLRRDPDPDGFLHQWRALDGGMQFANICAWVAASDEARVLDRGKRVSSATLVRDVMDRRQTLEQTVFLQRAVDAAVARTVVPVLDQLQALRHLIETQSRATSPSGRLMS